MDILISFLLSKVPEGNRNVAVFGYMDSYKLVYKDSIWMKVVENVSQSTQNKAFIIFVTEKYFFNEWTMVLLDKYNRNLYFYYTSSDYGDIEHKFQKIYREIAQTVVGVHDHSLTEHVKRISKDVYGQGECGLVILSLLQKFLERGEPEIDGISSLEISSIGFQCLKHIVPSLIPNYQYNC
jgi:hypothetical protein